MDALVDLVVEEPGIHLVGVARSGAEAVALARSQEPQVLVLDLEAANISAAWIAREINQHLPGTRLVALSNHDGASVRRAFDAGFHCHVDKISDIAYLLTILLEDNVFLVEHPLSKPFPTGPAGHGHGAGDRGDHGPAHAAGRDLVG